MKTTDLITLQNSITQGEWKAQKVIVDSHKNLGSFCPPAHWQITGEHTQIAATLVCELRPYGKFNDANSQAIALTPQLIAEVIKLRSALKFALGQLEGVKPMSGVHSSSLAADIAIARTALENT